MPRSARRKGDGSGSGGRKLLRFSDGVEAAVQSQHVRPGDVLSGTISTLRELVGHPGGFGSIRVKLGCRESLVRGTRKTGERASNVMVGEFYSSSSEPEYEDLYTDEHLVFADELVYDAKRDGPYDGKGKIDIPFEIEVPEQFDGVELMPSIPDYYDFYLWVFGSNIDGPEGVTEDLIWDLHVHQAYSSESSLISYAPFLMAAPWVPAAATSDGEDWVAEAVRKDIVLPRGVVSRMKNLLGSSKPAEYKGVTELKLWAPQDHFVVGKDIPVVLQYSVYVKDDADPKNVDWEAVLPALPYSGKKKDAEGELALVGELEMSVPRKRGGDNEKRTRDAYEYRDIVRWERGHLASANQNGKVSDPLDRAGQSDHTFELPGYGWSAPFQDWERNGAWTRAAYVRGTVTLPPGVPEHYQSEDGLVSLHTSLAFTVDIVTDAVIKDLPETLEVQRYQAVTYATPEHGAAKGSFGGTQHGEEDLPAYKE